MNNILKKTLTLGVVVSSVVAVSLVDAEKANALILNLTLNDGTFVNFGTNPSIPGGTLTGTFSYNTITNEYFNINLTSTSAAIDDFNSGAGSNPFTYSNNLIAGREVFSTTQLYIEAVDGSLERALDLEFKDSWSTFNASSIGSSNKLVINVARPLNASNETVYDFNGNARTAAISGGTVVVESVVDVPEPLTILGTLLAGGIGVAIKKKRGVSSSESC